MVKLLFGMLICGLVAVVGLILVADDEFVSSFEPKAPPPESAIMALRIPSDRYDGALLERGLKLTKAPGAASDSVMPFRVREDEGSSMLIYVDLARGATATLDNRDEEFNGSDFMLFDADMKRVQKMRHVSRAKVYRLEAK